MQLQQTSLLQTKTNYLTKTIYPYPCYLTSMLYHCHNRKGRTVSYKFFSTNFRLIPCTIMKKLGHIESLSLYLPIEPPLHAIHPPSFTWRLVRTLNQWEQKGKNKKNKSLAHMYTHTGQQNEFLWVHSGESCMGTENSVTTSDRRVCLPGTD